MISTFFESLENLQLHTGVRKESVGHVSSHDIIHDEPEIAKNKNEPVNDANEKVISAQRNDLEESKQTQPDENPNSTQIGSWSHPIKKLTELKTKKLLGDPAQLGEWALPVGDQKRNPKFVQVKSVSQPTKQQISEFNKNRSRMTRPVKPVKPLEEQWHQVNPKAHNSGSN